MNLILSMLFVLQVATTPPTANALDFFMPLLNNAPAFAILLYFSYRSLKNQDQQKEFVMQQLKEEKELLKKKEDEIRGLNDYLRNSEKENLEMLREMNSVIDGLTNNVKLSSDAVLQSLEKSIQDLKLHIEDKIKSINIESKKRITRTKENE